MIRPLLLLFCLTTFAPAYAAEPCTKATLDCSEWVNLGSQARALVYRTYALETKNEAIKRVLIVIHGANRDADNYFRTALAATFLANAFDDTIVIAPRFASNPNLKAIVLVGHSAGGQYVTRYEMANQVHDKLGVAITYVVSNPSSYAYLDPERPSGANNELRPFGDARNCTTYDNWPYGLKNRSGYTAKLSDEQLRTQLSARPVTYLLGELDILPLGGFDSSCPAMAQGPTRLARGQTFAAYVNAKYKAQHKAVVVPLCGHNARCMFTAEVALPILFPKT